MANRKDLNNISIRTEIRSGDLGYVMYRHGLLYKEEYDYDINFEVYVGLGLCEFYKNYDPNQDRVWFAEAENKIVGTVFLMHKENNSAQLRFFLIEPEYRGIGLGKKLMELYMDYLAEKGYQSSLLWTTHELDLAISLYKRHGFTLTEEKESSVYGKPIRLQRYDWISK